MTTDTQPLAPTDPEIIALAVAEGVKVRTGAGVVKIVRAALAKWGTPPAVAGEQVDRADAVNLARNTLTQHDRAITKKGVRVLAEAVLSMDAALITPQPTQAQAGAVPQYRLLVRGRDTIQADDEFLREDGVTWRKDPSRIFVGCMYEGAILLPARRVIKEGGQHGADT